MSNDDPTICVLDAKDRIDKVNDTWDVFAAQNGAPTLQGRYIIGRPLYDFIDGDVTRMFVSTMLTAARQADGPIIKPYRCDSPTHKRFMEMELRPLEGGNLMITHRLLHSTAITRTLSFICNTYSQLPSRVLRCSSCNRITLNRRDWHDHDEPSRTPELGSAKVIPVIYSICPDCRRTAGG